MPQNVGTVSLEATLDLRKATQAYNRFQRSIKQNARRDNIFSGISADARDFDNSLGKATNRVVAFGAAAAIFTTLSRATTAFASSIIEVDASLAKINVNLNQSASGLKKFGSDLFNVARQTGQTFDVAAKAAEELARQGLSAEETTKRLKDALILSRIAGIGSAEAVETLTAAINSFNAEALTSTEVVNKFAAVDTKFAVSSKDLAAAISRVGSTAQSAGVGINELIGLVTSLQQTTARGGATIGNGLKTIFTRIQAAPETVSALESIGVAIKNTDGSLRDAISILRDYGVARERVGEVERASLDRTVAGTFQINILKAALADLGKQYSVYGSAVSTASNSTDEAIRKNEQLNLTLQSLINSTGLSIKQLFANIGDQKLSGAFKEIFQLFERARSFLSGDSGEEIGRSLGDGILKGLSNVISGPGLLALTVILAVAFKKVFATLAGEARTLLSINGAVQTRANIQKQINFLLSNATELERAQYAAATSVLAKKEQILAIQARINQEELAGSPVARSFQVRGKLGFGTVSDPRIRRGNSFGIGNFADPIQSAIAREKAAGVPANQIYVDRDPRVASFANPAGILVANKRDEPLGGYQGVNRVIAQGGNPKTAGMGTPNFADTPVSSAERYNAAREIRSLFAALSKAKPLSEDFNRIGSQIQDASTKLSKVARENVLGKLANQFTNALIASRVVTASSGSNRYVTPSAGDGIDRSGTFGRTARGAGLPNRGILGPAFPINPQLQRQLAQQADFDAQDRIDQTFENSQRRRQKRIASIQQQRQSRSNRLLGASFALPFLSGFVPEGQGGTAGGITSGALKGAGTGAALGVLGPQAAAFGIVVGALVGGLSKLGKSVDEALKNIDDQNASNQVTLNAAGTALQALEQLKEAVASNESPATIRRLQSRLATAGGSIRDPDVQAALATGDPTKLSEAIDKFSNIAAQSGAGGNFVGRSSSLSPNRFLGGSFTREDRRSLANDLAGAIGQNAIKRDTSRLFQIAYGQTDTQGAIKDIRAIFDQIAQYAPALKDLDINASNVTGLSDVLIRTFQDVAKSGQVLTKALEKVPSTNRLTPGSFLSRPNLDVYGQAALTGRSPLANRGQRAQSRFDFFNELSGSGGIGKAALENDSTFKKAQAGVQANNIGDLLIRFLQGNNPGVGSLRDSGGNPNFTGIERMLDILSKSGTANAELAKLLLPLVPQVKNTLADNKVNSIPFTEGVSGFTPGADYGAFARSRKRGGPGYITSGGVVPPPFAGRRVLTGSDLNRDPYDGNGAGFDLRQKRPNGISNGGDYAALKEVPGDLQGDSGPRRDADIEAALQAIASAKEAALAVAAQSIQVNVTVSGLPADNVGLAGVIQSYLRNLGVPVPKPMPPGGNGMPLKTAQ